ncbi:MAG TPA: hypothetical protein VFK41_04455 [Nocardioidaceae bacterium]|nr:hypothetical protein [Nocardioidaceae bacterium]
MTNDMLPTAVRRAARALALVPGVLVLVTAGPALAERPGSDAWPTPDNDSTLQTLLVLGGIPFLLFVGIWVLAALPSMLKGQKYDAAVAFRDNPEWFGGPRRGVDAAPDDASEPQGRGGTSAQW